MINHLPVPLCSGVADDSCMCSWVASLPQHVHLPFLYFSDADLEACQDAEVISEAAAINDSVRATYEVRHCDPLLLIPGLVHIL